MRALLSALAALAGLVATVAHAANVAGRVQAAAQAHAAALPGKVSVVLPAAFAVLPACEDLQAQVPPGSPPWGQVQVALRCRGGAAWTRFVPVHIAVQVRHAVVVAALPAGHKLLAQDLRWEEADLAGLPADAVMDEAAAEGAVTVQPLAAGTPLRRSALRLLPVIVQGQSMRLLLQGPGYQLSTEGRAQTQAAPGQSVLLRLACGQASPRPACQAVRRHSTATTAVRRAATAAAHSQPAEGWAVAGRLSRAV